LLANLLLADVDSDPHGFGSRIKDLLEGLSILLSFVLIIYFVPKTYKKIFSYTGD